LKNQGEQGTLLTRGLSPCASVKNGLVYQYPNDSWRLQGITGHVDVVYRRRWASIYLRDVIGAPYNNFRTEVFH